jgi:hypothetical protein
MQPSSCATQGLGGNFDWGVRILCWFGCISPSKAVSCAWLASHREMQWPPACPHLWQVYWAKVTQAYWDL